MCEVKALILPNEFIFYERLLKFIGKDCYVNKSNNRFCSIDFIIIDKHNLRTIYLEHKYRNIEDMYNTLLIGKNKIDNIIKSKYRHSYVIWEFANDVFYVKKVLKEFIKYETSTYVNSEAYKVNKDECVKFNDIKDLCGFIYECVRKLN